MEIKYKNCVNELARRSLGIGGCKSVSKNGFTLVEVITAVGLLAIIIAFSSVIFNFGIDAYRISAANAEIMQKARALTEQLNSDLQGLRKDAPLAIWFQQDANNRYDQLMFFADGDFTSMQLYDSSGEPVDINDIDRGGDYISGNLARIHYGHTEDANGIDSSTLDKQKRSIGRRCHILTNDPNLDPWPNESDFGNSIGEQTTYSPRYLKNESYEHDTMPLNEWKKIDRYDFNDLAKVAFDNRPLFDSTDPDTYHNLMCEGISSFAVQWAYWDENSSFDEELRWFPSDDPNNDGPDPNDSHFVVMNRKYAEISGPEFGAIFNITGNPQVDKWLPPGMLYYYYNINTGIERAFTDDFFPDALKFTFTVCDSKRVIKDGRTFTHIVYLKD